MIDEVKSNHAASVQHLSSRSQTTELNKGLQQGQQGETPATTNTQADLSLTDTAAKLRQLEAQVANQPVVDSQRVDSVKKALADGSFSIDSNRIAEKMAQFEKLLADKNTKG